MGAYLRALHEHALLRQLPGRIVGRMAFDPYDPARGETTHHESLHAGQGILVIGVHKSAFGDRAALRGLAEKFERARASGQENPRLVITPERPLPLFRSDL